MSGNPFLLCIQVEEKTLHGALTTRKSLAGGTDFFVTPYRVEEVQYYCIHVLQRQVYSGMDNSLCDTVKQTYLHW